MSIKKLLSLLLSVVTIMSFVACSDGQKSVKLHSPDGELTVYCIGKNTPLYSSYLKDFQSKNPNLKLTIETFFSAEEMDARVLSDLKDGKGPDVLLLDDTTTLDIQDLSKEGKLLNLESLMNVDTTYSADNYYNVLSAGSYDGKQTVLPFTFGVVCAYTSQELMEQFGIELNYKNFSEKDFLNLLDEVCDQEDLGENYRALGGTMLGSIDRIGMDFNDLLYCTGNDLLTPDGTVKIPDDFEKISNLFVKIFKTKTANQNSNADYSKNLIGGVQHTLLQLVNQNILFYARMYDTAYTNGDAPMTPSILNIPLINGNDTYRGEITQFGCINAESKNENSAYQLLRGLMDYETTVPMTFADAELNSGGLPVSRKGMETQLKMANEVGGQGILSEEGRVNIKPFSEERVITLTHMFDNIGQCKIRNKQIENIISESMMPYFNETTMDYTECVGEMQSKINNYLDINAPHS